MLVRSDFETWGRFKRRAQRGVALHWRDASLPTLAGTWVLPYGQGRSYGDVAQNSGGLLLATRGLDRFITFDRVSGVLRAEAGVRLHDVLELTTPHGWYLPVVPGTKYISLGGAVANDVHGKNHHRAGTFGHHVRRFELLRSDGARLVCTPAVNADWFRATIGGLGLTGLITWVEVELQRTNCHWVEVDTMAVGSVADFVSLGEQSDATHEYTVGWFDCFSARDGAFHGLFTRGNPAEGGVESARGDRPLGSVPMVPPFGVLHPLAMRAFNRLYYRAGVRNAGRTKRLRLDRFLFPLDRLHDWNRLYGPTGFLQLQCLIPRNVAVQGTTALLDMIAQSGQGTFLGVIKQFGSKASLGMLSFPREGITVALDFPYRGPATLDLFARMHRLVTEYGGSLYPAKDACMSPATFECSYPEWRRLLPYLDPAFSSDFWRRVTDSGARPR